MIDLKFEGIPRHPTAANVLQEATIKITYAENTFRENMIRVCLQPKPRWLPQRVWMWLLKRILVVEDHRIRW